MLCPGSPPGIIRAAPAESSNDAVMAVADLTQNDLIGILWFFFVWVGYTLYADKYGAANGNLIGSMAQRRADWMMQMLRRENRIVDIQKIGRAACGERVGTYV